jgi:hypothetical protein
MESKALFEDIKPLGGGKRRKKESAPEFKEYNQNQRMLLPASLEEIIPENHLVRGVSKTIDQMNIEPLRETYQARANLETEKGRYLRKQRGVEIESVFGDIKWNQGYRRFRLRGLAKVHVEFGLLSMAHNMRKIAVFEQKNSAPEGTMGVKKAA